MESASVESLKIGDLIGRGVSGQVFRAEDADGHDVALKIFDEGSVNRDLLARMTRRLEDGGWPEGVMPVIGAGFNKFPAVRTMPLAADDGDGGSLVPRCLQHRLDEHPGIESWKLVKALAKALAGMHERRVPHGNLKPGNLMFDADGELLVTDWTLGNMPGARDVDFTDAVLYQAPEQLKNPGGYLEEAGYRWDVYSFGALSYRILTGRFPRCHDTFMQVAPPPGQTGREGLTADLGKIAENLEEKGGAEVEWPDEADNALEKGFRECIIRCLSLDARKRPASMVQVAAEFEAVERAVVLDEETENLLDQRRRAERATRRAVFALGVAVAGAMVFGGLWQLALAQLEGEKSKRAEDVSALRATADAANQAEADATAEAERARQRLSYERELWLTRLEASRLVGDRLFSWAMEKGHRQLPPLDGREQRLKRLERYFDDFLTRTASIRELADERARIRLALAEISLAKGDAAEAKLRLDEALDAWSVLKVDADLKFRMARNVLLLALLHQSHSDDEAGAAFARARKELEAVPRREVDGDRLDQLLAILDFQEARLLASKGEDSKALKQLLDATQTLNRLAEQRPESAVLKSELATCYLSSATILEGMGNLGDAREVRALAAEELLAELKQDPGNDALRLELAGCYGAMAETAVMAGDIGGAEELSAAAMKLLDGVLMKQPENTQAISRKAAQLGLRAGIMRDRGKAEEAMKDFDEGIRMLEAISVSKPDNVIVNYRLALLEWQKGRMLGMAGSRDEEIALEQKALSRLGDLEAKRAANGPSAEQLQRSTAYLLGDLGHAMQLAKRPKEARQAFASAEALWESLVGSRPQSEEYSEALMWCRQRLSAVK
ncbi:MAG: protein kinase domain-containing protein [Verrucomicrobiota bacterium JB025]|nr:hypothetical protein [Verrucomicrobiota bacterium JB025]